MDVLIIDDQKVLAELMGEAFRDEGYDVDVAFDGRAGLDLYVEHGHYDLVVADILMPGFDGIETIRGIRAVDSTSKVIAISGGGRLLSAELPLHMAAELGADAALAKPFRTSTLVELGNELLARRILH